MMPTLSAKNLIQRFVLFLLTVVFLLTMARAAYALWQFPKLEEAGAIIPLFVQGLRFDLALAGFILLVPVIVGALLSMSRYTRPVARVVITLFLIAGLLLVLLMELVTPWFIETYSMRPDMALLQQVPEPMNALQGVFQEHIVAALIGTVLCVLILIAFCFRIEPGQFLRYPLSVPSGLMLAVAGGLLCVVAVWSNLDFRKPAFSPNNAMISADATVNDLAMNSAYKVMYSFFQPYLNQYAGGSVDTSGLQSVEEQP